MPETTMPAAEAAVAENQVDVSSYEFAFHVLPTVAEGEVAGVTSALKTLIEKAGGDIFDEEAAQRFDLAYELQKYIEGKYRRFNSAYFGWIRFRLEPAALEALTEEIDAEKSLLRYITVRLTKVEEANPFRFHDALVDTKVRTIDTDEVAETEVATDEVAATDEVVEATATEEEAK